MYTVAFSPVAAGQYADIVARTAPYKKKLEIFEREIEQAICRLESMPSSWPPKRSKLIKSTPIYPWNQAFSTWWLSWTGIVGL